jgi:hypothetical protein
LGVKKTTLIGLISEQAIVNTGDKPVTGVAPLLEAYGLFSGQ